MSTGMHNSSHGLTDADWSRFLKSAPQAYLHLYGSLFGRSDSVCETSSFLPIKGYAASSVDRDEPSTPTSREGAAACCSRITVGLDEHCALREITPEKCLVCVRCTWFAMEKQP